MKTYTMTKPQEQLGLVDNVSTNHIADAYAQVEYNTTRPAVEGQPAIQANANLPGVNYGTGNYDTRDGGYVHAGKVLSDQYINFSDSGVHSVDVMTNNTSQEWEQQVRRQQQAQVRGRTRYNTPPTSGGFTPYVDVSDGKKATPEELEVQRKNETIEQLAGVLGRLQKEETTLRLKLQHNMEAQRNARERLTELD